MHLLIVTDAFPPDTGADPARLGAHSHFWADAGTKVSVVVSPAAPSCSGKRPAGPRRQKRATRQGKVRVARLERSARSPSRLWSRLENGFGLTLRLLLAGLRVGAVDVVLCASADTRVRWAALLLSRMRRRPLVLEVLRGPLHRAPDTHPSAAAPAPAPVGGAAGELWFCKAADIVIAASRSLRNALVELGARPTKVEVVADGLDWHRCTADRQGGRAAPGRKADASFVVGWSDVGADAHAEKLAAAVADKVDGAGDQARFRMVALEAGLGGGPAEGAHRRGASAAPEPVAEAEQPALQPATVAALDACVVVAGEEVLPRVPPLVYDCVGAAVPVVVGFQGETADLVAREGVGMVCCSADADVLWQQLLRLQQDALLRARLSAACREAAPRLDRASRAMHMLEVLRGVAAAHKMHRKWRYNRRLSGYRR